MRWDEVERRTGRVSGSVILSWWSKMNSGSSGLRATASIGADAETRQPLAIEQSIEVGASHGIAAPTQTQTPSKRTTHGSQWLYNARLKQSTIPQPRKNED